MATSYWSFRLLPPAIPMQLDVYQEQPHLLDSHLERIILPVMLRVRDRIRAWDAAQTLDAPPSKGAPSTSAPLRFADPLLHRLMRLIYALTKTRGHKTVAKFFPHDVADLEPVLHALVCQASARRSRGDATAFAIRELSVKVVSLRLP